VSVLGIASCKRSDGVYRQVHREKNPIEKFFQDSLHSCIIVRSLVSEAWISGWSMCISNFRSYIFFFIFWIFQYFRSVFVFVYEVQQSQIFNGLIFNFHRVLIFKYIIKYIIYNIMVFIWYFGYSLIIKRDIEIQDEDIVEWMKRHKNSRQWIGHSCQRERIRGEKKMNTRSLFAREGFSSPTVQWKRVTFEDRYHRQWQKFVSSFIPYLSQL